MNNSSAHQKLLDDVLFLFGSHPRIRIRNHKVGLATPIGANRPVYFGTKGNPDLEGIVAPSAHAFFIEIKTGTGTLSKDQIKWRDAMLPFGISYLVCHNKEEAVQFLKMILEL